MRKEVFPMSNQKKTGKWIRYATAFVLLLCFCLIQPVFGTIADAREIASADPDVSPQNQRLLIFPWRMPSILLR